MSNITSLSILREQLNQYLQELLRVRVIDIESGINQSCLQNTKEGGIGIDLPKSDGHLKLILGPENDEESKFDDSRTVSVHPEEKKLEEESQNTRSISNPHKFKPEYSTMNSDKDFQIVNNKVIA